MNWTKEQYEQWKNRTNQAGRVVSHAEPEHHEAAALDKPMERKEGCLARITVRFTGYRVRPLDPDNFAGSVKDLLDGLRHAGLIPGDEPWRIQLETGQVKVQHFTEERTVIEIWETGNE